MLPESEPTKQDTKRPHNHYRCRHPGTTPVYNLQSFDFNTCCHQPLPMMAGPLNIDPEATPVVAHKTASVPVHWEGKVNVRLGVIEKVPIGTPDTWCQRMMIVGKSNGEPRCVIDFQPLNAHATRETHHPLPSSSRHTQADEEVGVRRLERVSFCPIAFRGHPLHHIHHCLGKIPLPHRPQGLQVTGTLPNKVRRRHSDMVCGHRASIQRRG